MDLTQKVNEGKEIPMKDGGNNALKLAKTLTASLVSGISFGVAAYLLDRAITDESMDIVVPLGILTSTGLLTYYFGKELVESYRAK